MTLRRFLSGTTPTLAGLYLLMGFDSALAQVSVSTSPVEVFNGGPVISGASSTLVRNSSGMTAALQTSQLAPGGAYTLWFTVFNHPENCSPPACGLDDVIPFPGNVAAGTSLVLASGHVIGQNGKSSFAGRLDVGDTSGALFGPGLLSALASEIHLVVRAHGQPLPEVLDEQISSFNGGCPPNTCANVQASVHKPSAADSSLARLDRIESELAKAKQLIATIGLRLGVPLPANLTQ